MAVSETTRIMALELREGDRIRLDDDPTFREIRQLEWVPIDGQPSTIRVHLDDATRSSFIIACYVYVDIEPRAEPI